MSRSVRSITIRRSALPLVLLMAPNCRSDREPASEVRSAAGEVQSAPTRSSLTIRVLDVSDAPVGGLAVLVTDSSAGRARHLLVDGGERPRTVVDALRRLDIDSLALVVLTHPHTDHFGGLLEVLRRIPVAAFAWSGDARALESYRRLLRAVDASGATPLLVDSADRRVTLTTGADTLLVTLLAPPPPRPPPRPERTSRSRSGDAVNNRSVGVLLRYGAFSALVPGDAEHAELRFWTRRLGRALDVDVLVASHHGSRDANSTARNPDWYRIVTPRALLIGANGRQHPYADVLTYARSLGVASFCTHTGGALVARATRDGEFAVRAERPGECVPGTEIPR